MNTKIFSSGCREGNFEVATVTKNLIAKDEIMGRPISMAAFLTKEYAAAVN
jgi:hypothetical protein